MQIMEIIELELKNLSYNHKVTFNITAKTKMINLSWAQIIKISNIDTLDLLQELRKLGCPLSQKLEVILRMNNSKITMTRVLIMEDFV